MMHMEDRSARTDALAFLMRHKTGVLATAGHDNLPHGSVVHYDADDDFNVYFLTLPSSRKYQALSAHPQVAFTIFREDVPQTLQIEGMAKDITNALESKEKKDKVMEALNANPFFFPPISKLDPEVPAVIWLRPTWIRWADYAFAQYGTDRVFKEIPVKE
jgi:general stress protein 26